MISAVIIAKNSEAQIEEAIESVAFCDEVIIVDGGSTDNTTSVAKKLKAKIVSGAENDFAKQREKGMHEAKGDWVIYIDTDERVCPELAKEIQKVVTSSQYSAYRLQRKNFYLGNHEWPKIEKLERLFQKKHLKGWQGKLHETPLTEGKVGELKGFIFHYTHRTLDEMLAKTITWSGIEAQLRLDNKHPQVAWWRLIRVMMTGFFNSYVSQGGWKAGTAGLVESIYQAYSMFVTYAKLWEMQNEK